MKSTRYIVTVVNSDGTHSYPSLPVDELRAISFYWMQRPQAPRLSRPDAVCVAQTMMAIIRTLGHACRVEVRPAIGGARIAF